MKARVLMMPDGQLSLSIAEGGDFEEASAALKALCAELKVAVPITGDSPPERHRHPVKHEIVINQARR